MVSSYLYGVEEFSNLLSNCLLNYGRHIPSGFYTKYAGETVKQRYTLTDGPNAESDGERTEQKQWNDRAMDKRSRASVKRQGAGDFRGPANDLPTPWKQHSNARRIQAASSLTPLRNRTTDSTARREKEEQESHLIETIKSMRVNYDGDDSVLDFGDIPGLEDVKQTLEEFACFILHFPHLTHNLRQRSTTGILLFGPQGTGKTLLIKSFTKKYNLALYDIRASAIMSKYVGESEKFVRALFQEIRANAPSVLMLDECEGLLCNPAADATQSHNYRLLQNELKNQWSDLIYSRDDVIVIGATNKPHEIDMDGFGRRLSVKLHVSLPNSTACERILKLALNRIRHRLGDGDIANLGRLIYERGLSGYDVDCLIESLLRKAIRRITVAKYFTQVEWDGNWVYIPCERDDLGAIEGPWMHVATDPEEVSYQPFEMAQIKAGVENATPTVDHHMIHRHTEFASLYGTNQ